MVKSNRGFSAVSVISGVLTIGSAAVFAAEMDHSQHQGMDHSQHQAAVSTADAGSSQHQHHSHAAGGWMVEYKLMPMTMDGLLSGKDSVSTNEATMPKAMGGKGYMMVPTEMSMDMHMVMAMYGVSEKLTLMGMVNYLDKDMDMQMADMSNMPGGGMGGGMMNMDTNMQSSGVGDTQLGLMYQLNRKFITSVNLSIPTGSIDEEDKNDSRLPYQMQLGSGTYDLKPSLTYKDGQGALRYGAQASYLYRMGENDNDYTLGDRAELAGWLRYSLSRNFSLNGGLSYYDWDKIDGEDPKLAGRSAMSPTFDASNQGGTRMDASLGFSSSFGGGHMLGLELSVPIEQDLNGVQMETESMISLGWQYTI